MSKKTLFRRVFDAMIEGREKQAQRYIDEYVRSRLSTDQRGSQVARND